MAAVMAAIMVVIQFSLEQTNSIPASYIFDLWLIVPWKGVRNASTVFELYPLLGKLGKTKMISITAPIGVAHQFLNMWMRGMVV